MPAVKTPDYIAQLEPEYLRPAVDTGEVLDGLAG